MNHVGHKIHIGRWAAWLPKSGVQWFKSPKRCEEKEKPDLSFLPLVMRKRLSVQCKAALWLSHEVIQSSDHTHIPKDIHSVFATRYGEFTKTYAILNDILDGEIPSPAAFSSSVHKTAAGLWGIAQHSLSPSTTLSAGDNTLCAGLLEAALQARELGEPVLFHYSDVPLPDVYTLWNSVSSPIALSALVYPDTDTICSIDINFEQSRRLGLMASFQELVTQLEERKLAYA